jgi:hypothetical protein
LQTIQANFQKFRFTKQLQLNYLVNFISIGIIIAIVEFSSLINQQGEQYDVQEMQDACARSPESFRSLQEMQGREESDKVAVRLLGWR